MTVRFKYFYDSLNIELLASDCESDFVSFPPSGLTLVIKLRNFDFESH